MIHVLGNLACESAWRDAPPVPPPVATRIAALATLVRALVEDAVTVWTDVAVDPGRIPAVPGLPAPVLATGTPPAGAAVLAWGAAAALAGMRPPPAAALARALDPALRAALALPAPAVELAAAVNDRRLALACARELGVSIAGAGEVTDAAALDAAAASAAAASPTGEWVAKLPVTAAGRDRARGRVPVDAPARRTVARLIARQGAVVVEPWLARRHDLGTTGAIDATGAVTVLPPHRLVTDRRGGFRGIELAPVALDPADARRLDDVARAVGHALAGRGYRGPYTVDAFVHAGRGGADELRPLVEINARLSFGVVARALCARLGATRLGVGTDVPAGALVVIAPTAADPSAAWVS